MFGYRDICDSLFPHTCLIVPEKDVLETDIVGTGWVSRIKRWWNDQFLLSYSNEMAKEIFSSFNAMTYERFRHYRQFRNRIHPFSKFRNLWEFLILHVLLMNKFIFRFTSTFYFDELPTCIYYLGAFFEVIIIADLYVSMKTGYIDYESKRVILDTKESVLNFCSKKLFLHFASAIPLHWFMFLRYGSQINCGLCKTNRFNCALKMISVFSLFRVYEASAYWVQKHSKYIQFFKFFRIAVVGIATLYQLYDFSDAICLLVFFNTGYVIPYSSLGLRAKYKFSNGAASQNFKYMCYDISSVIKSWLLYSFARREPMYYLDKLFILAGNFLAYIFYAWTVLECYTMLNRLMYSKDRVMLTKSSALNLLKSRQLPEKLSTKIEMYFKIEEVRSFITEKRNELYKSLPEALKKEVKYNCYLKLIMRNPLFAQWPLPILEEIVLMLKIEIYLPDAIVAEAGMPGDGLMILVNGVCAVYSEGNEEIRHLIDGDYFGELSLVTNKELYANYVVAVTPCIILILKKSVFRVFMREHFNLFNGMKMIMKEKYNNSTGLQTSEEMESSELTISTKNDSVSVKADFRSKSNL